MDYHVKIKFDRNKWYTHVCFRDIYNKCYPYTFNYWIEPKTDNTSIWLSSIMEWAHINTVQTGKYKFQWTIHNKQDRTKMLVVASLLRYCEEAPDWVNEWVYLSTFMPKHLAYILCTYSKYANLYVHRLCSLYTRNWKSLPHPPLDFKHILQDLSNPGFPTYLNEYSVIDSYFKNLIHTAKNTSLWARENFNWTPETFKLFIELQPFYSLQDDNTTRMRRAFEVSTRN